MSCNNPIRLTVASRRDFVIPVRLLVLLALLSALLSFQLTLLTVLIFAAGWSIVTFGFSKVNEPKLILLIFADGRVNFEPFYKDTIEGFLDGQQWCTHQVAVLRVVDGNLLRRLVILSAQQQNTGNFRRLNMWLRQDFCRDTREEQVSGI